MRPLEIRSLLVLSTAHVKQETMEWLDGCDCLPCIASHAFGVYLWVPQADELAAVWHDWQESSGGTMPGDLREVLRFAAEQGADEVKLDSDGPVVEGLATYDWDEETSECASIK